ncbi:MAG TPA: heme-binding domain-containing protein [Acidobacteriaceae bacterium]|nr:heme-binding domain-containing protein [Acidobacteriaceae bacterium]
MSGLQRAAIFCGVAFAISVWSVLLARTHPFGDAGLDAASVAPRPVMEHAAVPPAVRAILNEKCADCHSAQTRAPMYARFAPASWWMERDIVEAREAMNLSLWERYSAEQQEALAAEIVIQAKLRTMPPVEYRLAHWNARMTDTDVQALTQWARNTSPHDSDSGGQALTEGDALRGEDIFERRCTGCHAMEQNREGPRLRGVFGRMSGAVTGFDYSPALAKAHMVWDEATLEQWLADPETLVPGNNMEFHVAKPQERRDLIRFLRDGAGK